jgi:NAD-dependent deacetylase
MIAPDLTTATERLRALVDEADIIVPFTGAGISTECGIPDFRSPGGLWTKTQPIPFGEFMASQDMRDEAWRRRFAMEKYFASAKPGRGHRALASLYRLGKVPAVITQNIDNLHQAAGSAEVVEYHGNTARVVCLDCGAHRPMARPEPGPGAPRCACGAAMKPDVVLFGETIPPKAMLRAAMWAQRADVVLVVGTSAQVYPAAGLPGQAKLHGARVIECNIAPTEFTGTLTDVFLEGAAGRLLPELAAAVLES